MPGGPVAQVAGHAASGLGIACGAASAEVALGPVDRLLDPRSPRAVTRLGSG